MSELSGSIEWIGIPALLQFLLGLRTGGRLRVTRGRWLGEMAFAPGRLVSASFGAWQGHVALEAIVLAFPTGTFSFSADEPVPNGNNLTLEGGDLLARVEALAARRIWLPDLASLLSAVPRVVSSDEWPASTGHVVLDRETLRILLAIDGRRTVAELVGPSGPAQVLRALATLGGLGLVAGKTRDVAP
jgi:hypothetical protein